MMFYTRWKPARLQQQTRDSRGAQRLM